MENNKTNDPKAFVDYVKSRREKGMTEGEIARSLGITVSEYRRLNSDARNALRKKG